MSQVKTGDTVKVHYSGTLDDGTQFDSSTGRDPLEFTIGAGQVIPGFDQAMIGMAVGDSKAVQIPCEEAYGHRNPDAIQQVSRDQIPANIDVSAGAQLQAQTPDGRQLLLTVVEANDDTVTLDANHPLAGQNLNFKITLVDIS